MRTVCCGFDEAGYGPMLGPLCVAAAAFRVAEPATDLWESLNTAVCRTPRDAARRIAFADSKKLKRPNSSKTVHPLEHLERGVLSVLQGDLTTDADLYTRLGVRLPETPCYSGDDIALPLGTDAASLRIDANRLATAMQDAGVELVGVRCVAIWEPAFNDVVRSAGSKARATATALVPLMRWAAKHAAEQQDALELVCDRQSGRTDYAPLLAECFPSAEFVRTHADDRSIGYRSRAGNTAAFQTEAEDACLPVALASMTAKLVRELAMMRFNRYWSARLPELKPTAGYVQDARRWLRDAAPVLTDADRASIVRIA
ncbi:MAG: hypothetical protein AAGI17_08790 [Planctomycetota bacterium]